MSVSLLKQRWAHLSNFSGSAAADPPSVMAFEKIGQFFKLAFCSITEFLVLLFPLISASFSFHYSSSNDRFPDLFNGEVEGGSLETFRCRGWRG